MLDEYVNILGQKLIDVSVNVVSFLPNFIIGVIVLLAGWVFGLILGRATVHIFEILKINNLFSRLGVSTISKKAGHDFTVGTFFGAIVRWAVIIAFSLAAANIFGLYYVSAFLVGILNYLPSVFIAGFIIVIGGLFANFSEKVIDGSVRASGLRISFAGTLARYAIMITAILAALNQLEIIPVFTNTLFIGIVSAICLAFALAFGLGGKDAAARAIEKIEKDFSKKQ